MQISCTDCIVYKTFNLHYYTSTVENIKYSPSELKEKIKVKCNCVYVVVAHFS